MIVARPTMLAADAVNQGQGSNYAARSRLEMGLALVSPEFNLGGARKPRLSRIVESLAHCKV